MSSTDPTSNAVLPGPSALLPGGGALIAVALAGCAVHRVGTVDAAADPVAIVSLEGGRERLMLLGDATGLRQLGEHLVEVDGRRSLGRIQVTTWRVLEGPHGFGVYVGPVQQLGVQIGVVDRASGELLVVDESTGRALSPLLGDEVVIEGYVDGPYHLRVIGWVPLAP